MKEIVLVRHGKSSWKYDVIDSERPLKQRGIDDSLLVIRELCVRDAVPITIFSSPANRTLSTCKIFTNFIEIPQDQIIVDENLYDFDGRNVIDFIKRLPNSIDDVMIFGHNHAFTSISNIFGNIYIDNLPTSGLVKLRFDIDDWKDLKKGITEFIITPKDLKA